MTASRTFEAFERVMEAFHDADKKAGDKAGMEGKCGEGKCGGKA